MFPSFVFLASLDNAIGFKLQSLSCLLRCIAEVRNACTAIQLAITGLRHIQYWGGIQVVETSSGSSDTPHEV